MEVNNNKKLEELQTNKPKKLLEEAHPEIREYILALERLFLDTTPFEKHYHEVNRKYLDIQEDMFALQVQMVECNYKIKELAEKNTKLRSENEHLKGKAEKCNGVEQKIHVPIDSGLKEQKINKETDPNENSANSILVKEAPKELFAHDPKKGVVSLGQLMNLQLTSEDIRKITVKERKFYQRQNMQPDNLIFIVELSNSEAKVNILKNKEKLKVHPSTKDIEIIDFVSEEVYNLYQYAKVLKSYGYHLVYWRNNAVYAKKTRSSNSQPILIESASQVDVLKQLK